jgi:hypothetical protein
MTKTCLGLLVAGTVVTVGTALVVVVAVLLLNPTKTEVENRNTVVNEEVHDNTIDDEVVDNNDVKDEENENWPDGTIVVEAGDGVLTKGKYSVFSYVGESARGLEAYIGDGGDFVTYEVASPNKGLYKLFVKLSDDGVHDDGARNATITINDMGILEYVHDSENTNGWKWYAIGTVNLNEGMNKIVFTKKETTSAAFVMDEFRLEVWGE